MGQLKSKFLQPSSDDGDIGNLKEDPDDKWSNLYREREKNHLYKWVGIRSGNLELTLFLLMHTSYFMEYTISPHIIV